jgi:hypothetical protein
VTNSILPALCTQADRFMATRSPPRGN